MGDALAHAPSWDGVRGMGNNGDWHLLLASGAFSS